MKTIPWKFLLLARDLQVLFEVAGQRCKDDGVRVCVGQAVMDPGSTRTKEFLWRANVHLFEKLTFTKDQVVVVWLVDEVQVIFRSIFAPFPEIGGCTFGSVDWHNDAITLRFTCAIEPRFRDVVVVSCNFVNFLSGVTSYEFANEEVL